MNELERKEIEVVKNILNDEILQMARGIEFRQDKEEVMEKINLYSKLLDKID